MIFNRFLNLFNLLIENHRKILLLVIFLPVSVSAQVFKATRISPQVYQIDFQLKGLHFQRSQGHSTEESQVIPEFEGGILIPEPNSPMLPVTGFALAYASSKTPAVSISSQNVKTIDGVAIKNFPDSLQLSSQEEPADETATISYTGSQLYKGVRLHQFRVRPIKYNFLTSHLEILSKLSFRITFPEEEQSVQAGTPEMISVLSGIVLNPAQIKYEKTGVNFNKNNRLWYDSTQVYLKINIASDGIYRVYPSDLAAAGVDPDKIDPIHSTLYFEGKPYPLFVRGEQDGSFDEGDFIEFFGRRRSGEGEFYNDYSDTSVYWLTWENQPGLRVKSRSVPPLSAALVTHFYETVHREEDLLYYNGDDDLSVFNTDKAPGEGWIWRRIYAGEEFSAQMNALQVANVDLPDTLRIKLRGLTNDFANPDHHLDVLVNNQSVGDFLFDGVGEYIYQTAIPGNLIHEGRNDVALRSLGDTGAQYDVVYLDWFELVYPKNTVASDNYLFFSFPDSLQNQFAQMSITNFHQDSILIYDITSLTRLVDFSVASYSDRFYVMLSDTVAPGNRYLASTVAAVKKPDQIVLDQPSNLHSHLNRADYIIITHKRFWPYAQQLAEFRQQNQKVAARVVDIENIFDEFNFGMIEPLAIRQFLSFAVKNWQKPVPKYVLLFGDASWDFKKNSANSRNNNFVPSYGNPVSDSRLVSIDGAHDFLPDLFVGRIPVASGEEAAAAVEKIIAYETTPFSYWNKNVVFLNGGVNDFEQSLFKNQAEGIIENYIEPAPFGGNPVRLYKESDGRLIGEMRDEIMSAIDDGALWLSFLGHAGSETWDLMLINEDIPQLQNTGKLPFVTSMTCHTARFANPVITSFGELFIKVPNRGAIAFWGTTGWGYIFQDKVLIDQLFKSVLRNRVETLGEATTLSRLYLWSVLGESQINKSTVDQYTLLGDPLQRLRMPDKPDYAIENHDIAVIPAKPTEDDSLLLVTAKLHNFGSVPVDSLTIRFNLLKMPEGVSLTEKLLKIEAPLFSDLLSIRLETKHHAGDVKLQVNLDPENLMPELYENNNMAELDLYIFSTSIAISKPAPFAAVSNTTPLLQVYSPESTELENRIYTFELDTTPEFDSVYLRTSGELPEKMIVTNWRITNVLNPGVYFWRCHMFNREQYSPWVIGRFTVIGQSEQAAWRQSVSTGFDFKTASHLELNNKKIVLQKDPDHSKHLEVQSAGYNDGDRCHLLIDYQLIHTAKRGINIVVLDGESGAVIAGPLVFDTFARSSAADSLAIFISTQPNQSVFLVGIKDDGSFSMTENAYLALESIGSQFCRKIGFRDSWSMIGRKNAAIGSVPESWLPAGEGVAVARDTLSIFYYQNGKIASGEIGPAIRWKRLDWQLLLPDDDTTFDLKLQGFERNQNLWQVLKTINGGDNIDLGFIDAGEYPKLKLELKLTSGDGLTSPEFSGWQVDYDQPPDFTTHPDLFVVKQDSLLEGTPVEVSVPVFNVGYDFSDSVSVLLELANRTSEWDSLPSHAVRVNADDSVRILFQVPTTGHTGSVKYRVTIDPKNQVNELAETNNQYTGTIFVRKDTIRPEIRILVDNQELLPGDLVAAEPEIKIEVTDNSPLAIDDTSLIRLYLNEQPLYYSKMPDRLELNNEPLSAGGGVKTSVFYRPELKSGEYVLEVIAKDATQNPTYGRADFSVSEEFALRDVLNVPNPFSTETNFTYILTQPANVVSLSVFTVSGRMIYKMDDLPIQTGFNTYLWNARDSDGDDIANGVYLYKIEAQLGDERVSEIGKLIIVK